MNVYVYTKVLTDWTHGMAVVAADTRSEADMMAAKESGFSVDHFAQAPCRVLPLDPNADQNPEVVAFVYGGS